MSVILSVLVQWPELAPRIPSKTTEPGASLVYHHGAEIQGQLRKSLSRAFGTLDTDAEYSADFDGADSAMEDDFLDDAEMRSSPAEPLHLASLIDISEHLIAQFCSSHNCRDFLNSLPFYHRESEIAEGASLSCQPSKTRSAGVLVFLFVLQYILEE